MTVMSAGVSPYTGGVLQAMLLTSDTTADTEWTTKASLDLFTTMDEYVTSGPTHFRETLTNITPAYSGTRATFNFDDIVWTSLAASLSGRLPTHLLIYLKLSGAAIDPSLEDRIPVALLDAAFTPDGTTFTAIVPLFGLFGVETAP